VPGGAGGFGFAATTAVGSDALVTLPPAFVAVTTPRTRWPASAAVSV
jgi:hypothetical protein